MRACRLARAKSLVGGLADADVKSTTMGLLRPGAPEARTPPPAAIGKRHLVSADRPARRLMGRVPDAVKGFHRPSLTPVPIKALWDHQSSGPSYLSQLRVDRIGNLDDAGGDALAAFGSRAVKRHAHS